MPCFSPGTGNDYNDEGEALPADSQGLFKASNVTLDP